MNPTVIIPFVVELVNLSVKIATIIEDAKDINEEDKELIKTRIKEARDKIKYWEDE